MALTRNFKETVIQRAQSDASFAQALLDEAATLFLNGEPETARLILRDLVNATIGFEQLATLTAKPSQARVCTGCCRPLATPVWTTWRPFFEQCANGYRSACRRTRSQLKTVDHSNLSLLGHFQRIIDLDAKVAHGALQFGVAKKQLHGTQVFCAPVDQRSLGPSHRMAVIFGGIQPNLGDPGVHDAGVLAGSDMG